jgi:hypothetical protein
MKFGMFRLAQPYFDEEGGGAGAAASTGAAATGAGATGGGQTGASATGTTGTAATATGTTAQTGQQTPKQFTYKEDRSSWVPSHVVRQRTQELERLKQEHFAAQQRIAALAGVSMPQAPVDPETAQIREQFNKLFPGLGKVEGLAEKLEKLAGMDFEKLQQSIEGTNNRMWENHGNHMSRILIDKAKDIYGGSELSPKAQGRLINAFVWELQNDDEMRQRYEAGDTGVLDTFLADYKGSNLEPYRKTTAAAAAPNVLAARRLPRMGGSSAVVGARPATLKPSDPGFHKAAFDRFRGEQG